jgi:glycosyltransferase involved in cell wall biosynthesis
MNNTLKPVRVLYILGTFGYGGLETWVMDVVRTIDRKEFQIDVCVTSDIKGEYEKELEQRGGRILRCPLNKTNPISFYHNFKKLLVRERYDIIHSHTYYFSGVVLRAAAKAGIAKRIAHIHPVVDQKQERKFRGFYTRLMRKWIVRYGTDFIGPTKASVEGFWGAEWAQDSNKHVVYNGIKIERFTNMPDRAVIRKEIDVPENAPLVLNVSRFVPHKRHEFFVEMAECVIRKRPDVHFLLIGAGPLKDRIKEIASEKGIIKNFRFVSGVSNLDDYVMSSDLFAFTSCNEGFGIVIIEAAAAGLKVIAQDIPGVCEAIVACPEGMLLPLETSAEEWSKTVICALEQPRMQEDRRQQLLKEFPFTIEKSVAKLKEVYYS